jgi:hypothetical protein
MSMTAASPGTATRNAVLNTKAGPEVKTELAGAGRERERAWTDGG